MVKIFRSQSFYFIQAGDQEKYTYLPGIYLFEANNRNTKAMCEICSKITITGVVLVSLLLYFNRFHTLLWYMFCWLWKVNIGSTLTFSYLSHFWDCLLDEEETITITSKRENDNNGAAEIHTEKEGLIEKKNVYCRMRVMKVTISSHWLRILVFI